jgi:hypothetical protein
MEAVEAAATAVEELVVGGETAETVEDFVLETVVEKHILETVEDFVHETVVVEVAATFAEVLEAVGTVVEHILELVHSA